MIKRISISFSEKLSSDESSNNQDDVPKNDVPPSPPDNDRRKTKRDVRHHLLTLKKPSPKNSYTWWEEVNNTEADEENREECTFEIIPPENATKIKKNTYGNKNGAPSPPKQVATNIKYDLPRHNKDPLLVNVHVPGNVFVKSPKPWHDSAGETEEFEYDPLESDSQSTQRGLSRKFANWETKFGSPRKDQTDPVKSLKKRTPPKINNKCKIHSPDSFRLYSGDSQAHSDFTYRFNECKTRDCGDSDSSSDGRSSSPNTVIMRNDHQEKEHNKERSLHKASGKTSTPKRKTVLKSESPVVKSKVIQPKVHSKAIQPKPSPKFVKKKTIEDWKEGKYNDIASILYKIPKSKRNNSMNDSEKSQRCGHKDKNIGIPKGVRPKVPKGKEVSDVQGSSIFKRQDRMKTPIKQWSPSKTVHYSKSEAYSPDVKSYCNKMKTIKKLDVNTTVNPQLNKFFKKSSASEPKIVGASPHDSKADINLPKSKKIVVNKPVAQPNKIMKDRPQSSQVKNVSPKVVLEDNKKSKSCDEQRVDHQGRVMSPSVRKVKETNRLSPHLRASPGFRNSNRLVSPSSNKKTVNKPAELKSKQKDKKLQNPTPMQENFQFTVRNTGRSYVESNFKNYPKHASPQENMDTQEGMESERDMSSREINKSGALCPLEHGDVGGAVNSSPKLYLLGVNRNVSSELLNQFNSGFVMSSILYEKNASPKPTNELKTINENCSKDKKNEIKPLVDMVTTDNVHPVDTREKLMRFNMGDEMTLALYGTSNIKEKSQADGITSNQTKSRGEAERDSVTGKGFSHSENCHKKGENSLNFNSTGNPNLEEVTRYDVFDQWGNPIDGAIADNMLCSTIPKAVNGNVPEQSPIIIYFPTDYPRIHKGKVSFNFPEGQAAPLVQPIQYHQTSSPTTRNAEAFIANNPEQVVYIPIDVNQQVGGRHPNMAVLCEESRRNSPGWGGRKIAADSSSGADMARILYGRSPEKRLMYPRNQEGTNRRAGGDRISGVSRRWQMDGNLSNANGRQDPERRPCGIYPGLVVDDEEYYL